MHNSSISAKSRLLLIVALGLLCMPQSLPAQEPSEVDAQFVLHGIQAGRDRLRSGICRITFATKFNDLETSTLIESCERWLLFAFDHPRRVRIDWTMPSNEALVHPNNFEMPGNPDKLTGYFVHTPERNMQWFEGHASLNILPPESGHPGWVDYFDPQALGMYSWIEFQQGLKLAEIVDAFLKTSAHTVVEAPDDVYIVTWKIGGSNMEWVLTVDAQKGFAPIHAQQRQRRSPSAPWETVQEYTTKWQKAADVWVPIQHSGYAIQGDGKTSRELSMELSWEKVNETLADELFAYAAFGSPDRVRIVDSTLGTPVITKEAWAPHMQTDPRTDTRVPKRRSRTRIFLLSVGLLFLTVAVVAMLVGMRSRRRGADGG